MRRYLLLAILPALALAIYDMEWYDLNNWLCPFYNDGRWGRDVTQGSGIAGGCWPRPLHNAYIFGAGSWVGAVVDGETLVTVGYNPSSGGGEFGPTLCRYWREGTGNPEDRIYKYPGDWPPPQSRFPMAPQRPRSEMDFWCCHGDSTPINHEVQWSACDVAVVGSRAYVVGVNETLRTGGLDIIDVASPRNPDAIGCYLTQERVRGVAAVGDYAYVADDSALRVVDVSNPQDPYETGRCTIPDPPAGVAVAGSYACVATRWQLFSIDVSDPRYPRRAGSCSPSVGGRGVAVVDSHAYVVYNGFGIIDISDPEAPREVGTCVTPSLAYDVAVQGGYAYVADGRSGVCVIDISDPRNPHQVGICSTVGDARGVTVVGNFAYVASNDLGLLVLDVTDPEDPHVEGACIPPLGRARATSLAVAGSYAYLTDMWSGLRVADISDPQNPQEVGYCTPGTRPLGIDVSATVFGFSDSIARDFFILRYDLVNSSGSPLARSYFGMMMDGDVGNATDDMTGLMLDKVFGVGPDTFHVSNTGYIYDYDNRENPGQNWQSGTPGAVAIRLLQAPNGLGMTSFKRFTIDSDPVANPTQYLTMAGYNYRTGEYEPFDSVDVIPGDKRVLLSTGPFDLPAESTVTFYYAVIGAPYGAANQPPGDRDTTDLGLRCWWAESALQRVLAVEEAPSQSPPNLQLRVAPNPFSPAHPLTVQAPGIYELVADVYDAGGRLVRRLAGSGSLILNGCDDSGKVLPAGLYFVTIRSSVGTVTHKVLLQH